MKKTVIFLCLAVLCAQSYSQNRFWANLFKAKQSKSGETCVETFPYQPNFGEGSAVLQDGWLFDVDNHASANNDWTFQTVSSEGSTVVAHYRNYTGSARTRSLYSRCLSLDKTQKYELKFTFVGMTVGATQTLRICLVESHDGGYYSQNDTFLIEARALPYGQTQVSVIVDRFPELANSNYRLAFHAENVQGGVQFYLKDIVFQDVPQYRLVLGGLNSPLSSCDLSNQTVSFKVRNEGIDCPATYTLNYRYRIGDQAFGDIVSENFTTGIAYGTTQTISFANKRTFDAEQTVLQAWLSYNEMTGAPDTLQQTISRTAAQSTPYDFSFNDNRDWVVIPKAEYSEVTWNIYTGSRQAVIATTGVASDDRLVSGCITLEKGVMYRVSFTYRAGSTRPEKLSLYVGRSNTPSDSDITLIDLKGFNSTESRTISTYFTPSEDGSHFFGFYAYSDASSEGITLSSFSIAEAPEPATVPVYMGFESYDRGEELWQMFDYNFGQSGWQKTTTTITGGNALQSISKSTSSTASARNDNWLISEPVRLEAGKPYEILYLRRRLNNQGDREILNVRVSHHIELQTLSGDEPLLRDTVSNWNPNAAVSDNVKKTYFTPEESGVYFVTFQYHSALERQGSSALGLLLDDIAIRDSASAADTNLSVVGLEVPAPSCDLLTNAQAYVIVKNRGGHDIVNAAGFRYYFQVNTRGATSQALTINAYEQQRFTIPGTGNFPANASTFEVVAWIAGNADKNKSDDTSAIGRTERIQPAEGKYTMGFEANENTNHWSKTETGTEASRWQFITNSSAARTGNGVAYQAPMLGSSTTNRYIATPCLSLSTDTTYFISYFYRTAQTAPDPTVLNVFVGSNASSTSGQPRKSDTIGTTPAYQRAYLYFRPSGDPGMTLTQYVTIESVIATRGGSSTYETGGIYLDDFVVMDSAQAHRPNLSVSRLRVLSTDRCDLASDTLYVEIENNGVFDYDERLKITVQFDNQTFADSVQGAIPANGSRMFKLNTLFSHANYGVDSVRVWIDLPNNDPESRGTSEFVKIARYLPTEPPYAVNFREAELPGWNNLNEGLEGNAFDYWRFNSVGTETNAFFENGASQSKPGILVSGCLALKADDSYNVTYRYRAANASYSENLLVLRYRADGTADTIYRHASFSNTTYFSNTLTVKAISGNERIGFFTRNNTQSRGIYIDAFSIVEDTASWPADIELLKIISPQSDTSLTQVDVTVSVTNINRRPLKNVGMFYTLDGALHSDVLPALNPGDTLSFTFAQKADLSAHGDHELIVFAGFTTGDVNSGNDTLRTTIINYEPTPPPSRLTLGEEASPLTIYPNPATTEVFLKSDAVISTLFIYDLRGNLVGEVRVNSTEYRLNTSAYPTGLYLFTCQIGDLRHSRRVIIQNPRP